MADETPSDPKPSEKPDHEPPAGAQSRATWSLGERRLEYTASAGWTVLRKREKPAAEIFSVAYIAERESEGLGDRPVTFVFNGGPGASSVYLHLGAVGPRRVAFPANGTLPRVPPQLVANDESWFAFTDLVFVDPVGTGFSRAIEKDATQEKSESKGGDEEDPGREFFGYKRDLESLCEFMSRWLSGEARWGSPVFIAGESYGGYRVGRLVRMLQETTGIGLSGAVLISPALELQQLEPTDYDALGWVDLLPTMALAAAHHGRSRAFAPGTAEAEILAEVEPFATAEYLTLLARGAGMAATDRERILGRLADLLGLPFELVARAEGRVGVDVFVRELLRDERRVLGMYDATITTVDPFPDRAEFEGADPTLTGVDSAYTMAVNRQLRGEIGIDTDREYVVLSLEVNQQWRNDAPEHFFIAPTSATDDFRYGMALNPHLRAFITHGRYDLVTPFHATDRLRDLMRLEPEVAERLTVRHFGGGHMFYAWEDSRREFRDAMATFYADALADV